MLSGTCNNLGLVNNAPLYVYLHEYEDSRHEMFIILPNPSPIPIRVTQKATTTDPALSVDPQAT